MAIISGINDIKAKCLNSSFKKCRVIFRKGNPIFSCTELKLSSLVNISLISHKDLILCYCDGIIQTPEKEEETEEKIDVELEDPFFNYTFLEKEELQEDIEFLYEKEKKDWIHRFSKNDNLINAINLDYSCDTEYCLERISREQPGFFMVDETTTFYQKSCPSNLAISIEKRLSLQINGSKSKYGTYTRIVKLESHKHINYYDLEAVVLFNYLNKFDICALVSVVEEQLDGKQQQCSGSALFCN